MRCKRTTAARTICPLRLTFNSIAILHCNKANARLCNLWLRENYFMNRVAFIVGSVCVGLLAACAAPRPALPPASGSRSGAPAAVPVPAPSLGFFSKIKAPSTHEPTLQLASRGVQIFRCEKRDAGLNWVFRQPQADLLDSSGKAVGKHGANFSFEHDDGSRLVSTITAYDEASKPTDLRWLLLSTRSFGKGVLENVTHVQRVNTAGGMPPTRCEPAQLNQLLRVDFTSDFVFYRPRPE